MWTVLTVVMETGACLLHPLTLPATVLLSTTVSAGSLETALATVDA